MSRVLKFDLPPVDCSAHDQHTLMLRSAHDELRHMWDINCKLVTLLCSCEQVLAAGFEIR